MNKNLLLSLLVFLMGAGWANAQSVYTYVKQNGTVVTADGTAVFDLSKQPAVEYDTDGNAVMTINGQTVATLPVNSTSNGELVVDFADNSGNTATAGTLPVTVTAAGYGTLYSPFQLQVPEDAAVEVYAPTYDAATQAIDCNSTTQVTPKAVVPAGTGLLLKNAGDITFTISSDAATDEHTSAFSGSALTIDKPDVAPQVVYTLGYEATSNVVGFFAYTGTEMSPAKAYLIADALSQEEGAPERYVAINFNEAQSPTGLSEAEDGSVTTKYIQDGKLYIQKDGIRYDATGRQVK